MSGDVSVESGGSAISVLIADDHGLVRAGLRSILSSEADIAVVGEAEDGAQALDLAARLRPDVVLADISMPPPDGIELARRLRTQLPKSRTLIVSMHEDSAMLHDALSAGAAGYLIKRALEHDLTRAIRTVAAGQQYIHETMKPFLALDPVEPRPSGGGSALLEASEVTLLRMLAGGATLQQVATALRVTPEQARTMRDRVTSRLGLQTRVDIVRYVQRYLQD